MAHIIPSGRRAAARFLTFCILSVLFSALCFAAPPTCVVTAGGPTVHLEGLAEQVGDITVSCSGGTGTVDTLLILVLNGNVTNRLDDNGNLLNITVNGATSLQPPTLNSPNTILFGDVQVTGALATITISGIRVAVPTVAGTAVPRLINATVAANQLLINSQPTVVGVAQPTLLASAANYGVPCAGSPLPSSVTFDGFIAAQTSSSTVRVTEANSSGFTPKLGAADFGTRFLITLGGYGTKAQIYVPDVIVGNISPTPTSGGAFATPASGGFFTPNTNQILLARVAGADANGAGGTPVLSVAPGSTQGFESMSQIPLTNGSGTVTYEVILASNIVTDSAQIPVFVVVPASSCSTALANTLSVSLAPASNVSVPTQGDPIPRYIPTVPGSDCSVIGDCSASYVPVLQAAPTAVTLNSSSLGAAQTGFITITDGGQQATQLSFNVSISYQPFAGQSNANWLTVNGSVLQNSAYTVSGVVDPAGGIPSFTLKLVADPSAITVPGNYAATATISGAGTGTITVPITFIVGPPGVVIQSVVNAANGQPGPITANSFVSIYGINLVAKNSLTVTFNGFPATVSFDGQPSSTSASQINVLVPAAVGSATAGVVVTVDGAVSNTFPVNLVTNAPAVFNPGILNQNNTVNLSTVPGSRGDIVQIFLTGLATPVGLPVTVKLGTQTLGGAQILYAGPVVSIPGLEQVNVQVPTGFSFTGNSAALSVCVPDTNSQPLCSAPVNLYLNQ